MEVETYECTETAAEPIEASEEALGIIEALGLEGQKALSVKADSGIEVRCPYREMTRDEVFAYGVICPEKTELKKYNKGPIPLRVLQIAAHADGLGFFDKLIVWHAASAREPDPVLVARKGGDYSWDAKHFILARWGEALETFSGLLTRACKQKRQALIDQAQVAATKSAQLAGIVNSLTEDQIIHCGVDAIIEIKLPEW